MALAFGSAQRLERLLLKTRNILGEGDNTFRDDNKTQALQLAASLYGLYGGDGSETTYSDGASTTIIQSEMIATKAAMELILSAISYYKDDVVDAQGGPASASFRSDKLAWLRAEYDMLAKKLEELENNQGILDTGMGPEGLCLEKVRACADPVDDVCCDEDSTFPNGNPSGSVGV